VAHHMFCVELPTYSFVIIHTCCSLSALTSVRSPVRHC